MIIHKSFVRPHLDYGDVIHNQPNNFSLSDKIETVQYDAALAITDTIRETSKEKLYQKFGLASLKDRRCLRWMLYLFKVVWTKLPPYLYEIIPPLQMPNRYPGCFLSFHCRNKLFQNSFLLFIFAEWKKFDSDIKNVDSRAMFRKNILTFI